MSVDKEFQKKVSAFKTAKDLLALKGVLKGNTGEAGIRKAENDVQVQLVNIYKLLTNTEQVGISHDFFKIGGNSLKAVYLISSISKIFNVQLSLVDVFRNPVIQDLAVLIERRPGQVSDIEVLESQEYFPASHGQKLIWILDHLDQRHTSYNMPDAFKIEGRLDQAALGRAFQRVIELHESLRTTFVNIKGQLHQKIKMPGTGAVSFEFLDLRGQEQAEAVVHKWISVEVTTPFDLENGPLIRARLFRVEEQIFFYVLNLHHIIADGWSINELTKQIFELYGHFGGGAEPAGNPSSIQYKDYVAWFNNVWSPARRREDREYWLNRLSGNLPVLVLSDKPRPRDRDFDGNTISVEIPNEMVARLKAFSAAHDVTMFMLLQALASVLLSKYSGEEDIIMGTPVSGRAHRQLDNQIGLYLNNIVLRNRVGVEGTFTRFLGQVKENTLGSFAHESYPFDQLMEDLNIKVMDGRNAIYDIMIVMETNDMFFGQKGDESLFLKDLKVIDVKIPNPVSKLDLTFFFRVEDTIKINLEYRTGIFDAGVINGMAADLLSLMNAVTGKPGITLLEMKYSIMTPKEQQQHAERRALLTTQFNQDF